MFTTVAFSDSVATAATAEELDAIKDQSHTISGTDLYIGKWNKIVGECVLGYATATAYLTSPSLRRLGRHYLYPFCYPADIQYNVKQPLTWHADFPLELLMNEALNAVVEGSGINSEWSHVVGVWLMDKLEPVPKGEFRTIHAYCTGTYPVETWTNDALTFTEDLPVGHYAIIGANGYLYDARGLFRFVPLDSPNRPGGVTKDEFCLDDVFPQRYGRMGMWCEFDSVRPPTVDIITPHSTSATELYLRIDLIKMS